MHVSCTVILVRCCAASLARHRRANPALGGRRVPDRPAMIEGLCRDRYGFGGGRQIVKDEQSSGSERTTPPASGPAARLAPAQTRTARARLRAASGSQPTTPPASGPAARLAPAQTRTARARLRAASGSQPTTPPASGPAARLAPAQTRTARARLRAASGSQPTTPPASGPAARLAPAQTRTARARLRAASGSQPTALAPAREVNLAPCHVTGVREVGEIERFVSKREKHIRTIVNLQS